MILRENKFFAIYFGSGWILFIVCREFLKGSCKIYVLKRVVTYVTILPKEMTPNVFFPVHSRSRNNKLNRLFWGSVIIADSTTPVDTRRKLNAHKTFRGTGTTSRQTSTAIDKEIDRRVLRTDKWVLHVSKQRTTVPVLLVVKRVLWVTRRVLQILWITRRFLQ